MISPLNIFEFYKLLKMIPLYMMVATPDTYPVRSYHQGNGVHPYGVELEYIKLSEVAINLGQEIRLNDGG